MKNFTEIKNPNGIPSQKPSWSALILVALFLSGICAHAQTYSIDWFTIDGGGGTSTGGAYAVSGTIGQLDAGTLSGGSYTLDGGFWPGIIVPSTGEAPTLFIELSGSTVIISWSPATPGFTLEQTDSLPPASWSVGPAGNPAMIPISAATRLFRLKKP